MKQNNVTRRLAEQLREKLGYILLFEIADPRLDLVTITGVEVSQDRSYARIFVSCEGARYEEVLGALGALDEAERAAGRPPVELGFVEGILEDLEREGFCARLDAAEGDEACWAIR